MKILLEQTEMFFIKKPLENPTELFIFIEIKINP